MRDSENVEWAERAARFVNDRMQAGQWFLGAVNGGDAIELVFTMPPGCRYNLITISGDGIHVGSVADPEAYVDPDSGWPNL